MKVLILFYSRTGNNRTLANYLADKIEADIEEIIPVRKLKRGDFSLISSKKVNRKFHQL